MRRNIEKSLLEWKSNPRRSPLLILGARQVGKTYAVDTLFGPSSFDRMIKVDLRSDQASRRYIKNHPDAEKIIRYLENRYETPIDENTLLFFDEAQEAVQILTAAKYFKQNFPKIPVIITGSLVRVKLKQLESENGGERIALDPEIEPENQDGHNNFLYPVGCLQELSMYPLTFDEFLLAYRPTLYETVKNSFISKTPLEKELHDLAIEAFFLYLQVGGMPDAVMSFLETSSPVKARVVLRGIFDSYLSDMGLYQLSSATIARSRMIYESIFTQLNKENKNFKIADIEKGKRFRDYLNPFDWLVLARLVYKTNLAKERVVLPLAPENDSLFRVYLPDCGLFAYESKMNLNDFIPSFETNSFSGIFIENYVAEELSARGIELFYWKGKSSSEFEFLLDIDSKVVPLDAKKGRGGLDSLKVFQNFNPLHFAIKVSANRYGYDETRKILTLPFYYLPFYLDELKEQGRIV